MATDMQQGFGRSRPVRTGSPAGTSRTSVALRQGLQRVQNTEPRQLAWALGWFSIGLGLAELALPRGVGHAAGIGPRPVLLRVCGARELAAGIGLLSARAPQPWIWSRVLGDTMDLMLLATGLRSGSRHRGRAGMAFALVAGVTALDIITAVRLGAREPRVGRVGVRGLLGARRGPSELYIEKSVIIGKPPEECYRYWRTLENLPRFMRDLESVRPLDERRSHWVLRGPGAARIEWDAEIIEDRPGERLAWRTLNGAAVRHAGAVHFTAAPAGRGTLVRVTMHYSPVGGRMSRVLARVLGHDPDSKVKEDLRQLRQMLETGEVPTTRGQPAGRRSFLGAGLQQWSATT